MNRWSPIPTFRASRAFRANSFQHGAAWCAACLLLWLACSLEAQESTETRDALTGAFQNNELVEVEVSDAWLSGQVVKEVKAGLFRVRVEYQGKREERIFKAAKIRRATDTPVFPLSPLRTWKDASGKHRLEARLLELAGGSVELLKKDGKSIAVPLNKLCLTDQMLTRKLARREEERKAREESRDEDGTGERQVREPRALGEVPPADRREVMEPAAEPAVDAEAERAARAAGHGPAQTQAVAAPLEGAQPTTSVDPFPALPNEAAPPESAPAPAPTPTSAAVAPVPVTENGALSVAAAPVESWQVTPEPIQMAMPPQATITFPSAAEFDPLASRLFLAPLGQRALVVLSPGNGSPPEYHLIDLAGQSEINGGPLPADVGNVLDFSADGQRMLTTTNSAEGLPQLTQWSFTDQGVVPQSAAQLPETIPVEQAQWIDDTHLLVRRGNRIAALDWTAADSPRIQYQVDADVTSWTFSHTGRLVFLATETGILVVEAAAGTPVGWLAIENGPVQSMGISDDGIQLAGLAASGLMRWDLTAGQPLELIGPIQAPSGGRVDWINPNYVLLAGSELVDLAKKQIVWRYLDATTGAAPLMTAHGESVWYVAKAGEGTSLGLSSATLPHAGLGAPTEGADPQSPGTSPYPPPNASGGHGHGHGS